MGRQKRLLWVGGVATVAVMGLGSTVSALDGPEGGEPVVYHACLTHGHLSEVGTSRPRHCDGHRISWNKEGPTGPAGVAGPKGKEGPKGDAGAAGATGATGATGPSGPGGANGKDGVNGAVGPTGPSGPAGAVGPAGPTGPAGVDGAVGPAGPIGPTGPAGTNAIVNYGYWYNASPSQQQSSAFNDVVSFDSAGPATTGGFNYNVLGAPWVTVMNSGVYRISFNLHVAAGGSGNNPYGLVLNGVVIPGSTQLADIGSGKEELHGEALVQISNPNAHLTLQNLGHILNLVTDASLMVEQIA
jgi:hypothetical protein